MRHPFVRNVVLPAISASIFLQPLAAMAGASTTTAIHQTHAVVHHDVVLTHRISMVAATVRLPVAVSMITARDFQEWSRVNICEESGQWHVLGSRFSGGLGISNQNWVAYGGRQFAWNAAYATPAEQIVVAKRIQANPPDQHGCAAW
jgi:hypothetical protein